MERLTPAGQCRGRGTDGAVRVAEAAKQEGQGTGGHGVVCQGRQVMNVSVMMPALWWWYGGGVVVFKEPHFL